MEKILLTIIIGIIVGIIDVLPMVKMKIDKYATSSAFLFYFIMPFIIFNTTLLQSVWWLKGGLITFILSLPIVILVLKEDKHGAIPMVIMSIILGTIIGITGHFLGIM